LELEVTQLCDWASQEADYVLAARQSGELADQLSDFQGAERELDARLACMQEESSALRRKYDLLKQRLFIYAAALVRQVPCRSAHDQLPTPPDAARTSASRGIEALIGMLAQCCGWSEVAFLQLDVRRRGRLNSEGLHLSLLLGLGVDYPRLTGLSIQSLFSKLDRRNVGHITVADLCACCPGVWQTHGEKPVIPMEKVRALPYSAVGGATECFAELATARGLAWEPFEELLCRRLRGASTEEAQSLFSDLASSASGTAISLEKWVSATADVPKTLAFF